MEPITEFIGFCRQGLHGTRLQSAWLPLCSWPVDDDDERIFRFDRHLFVEGEYVTVTEHDGVARPFRVVLVAPAVVRH